MEDKLLTIFDCLVVLCGFATLCLIGVFICQNPEVIGAQDAWNQSSGIVEQVGLGDPEDL